MEVVEALQAFYGAHPPPSAAASAQVRAVLLDVLPQEELAELATALAEKQRSTVFGTLLNTTR
jgi:hypothetical protein